MEKRNRKENELFARQRIVVKIGTRTLCEEGGRIRQEFVSGIAGQIMSLRERGVQTILVSSGAAELGRVRMPFVADTSLASAMGQPLLMQVWNKAFYPIPALQFLFTQNDYKNEGVVKRLITDGLAYGIPIINGPGTENNDSHASKIARIMDADSLVLLTNKHGLLDQRQHTVPLVSHLGDVAHLIRRDNSNGGNGGMGIKASEALTFAQATGRQAFIAHGHQRDILHQLVQGNYQGATRFA